MVGGTPEGITMCYDLQALTNGSTKSSYLQRDRTIVFRCMFLQLAHWVRVSNLSQYVLSICKTLYVLSFVSPYVGRSQRRAPKKLKRTKQMDVDNCPFPI